MCLLFIFSYELDSALFFSDTRVIEEFWCILCTVKRKGEDFHKTWMGSNNVVKMYGDSLQDKYLSFKNKTVLIDFWATDDAEAICSSVGMLHVAPGCHQDRRRCHIIIRSLYCHLQGFSALFLISLSLSVHWCAAFVLHYWEQLSVKQRDGCWSLEFYFSLGSSSKGGALT